MARSRSGPAVSVRLGTEGGDEVKRDFDQIGESGKRALDKIRNAGKEVGPALKGVDAASRELQARAQGLAGPAGAVGRVLTAMGPGGLAAAAGIGLTVLAIRGAMRVAREAVNDFDELGKKIADLGVDGDLYQGLRFAGRLNGMDPARFDDAMRTFAIRSEEIAAGVGKSVKALETFDPQLLKAIRSATTVEARLKAVADAWAKETDATRKATVAKSLFGDANIRMVQVIGGGSAAIDNFVRQAREMGIVISASLIANAGRLADQMDIASTAIDLNFKQALISVAPVIVAVAGGIAGLASALADLFDGSRPKPLLNALDAVHAGMAKWSGELERLQGERKILESSGTPGAPVPTMQFVEIDRRIAYARKGMEALAKAEKDILNKVGETTNPPADPGAVAVKNAEAFAEIAAELDRGLTSVANKAEQIGKVRENLDLMVERLDGLRGKSGIADAEIDRQIAVAREVAARQIRRIEDADKGTQATAGAEQARKRELQSLSERLAAGIKYRDLLKDIAAAVDKNLLTETEANIARAKAQADYNAALEKERRLLLERQNTFGSGLALGLAEWSDRARETARSVADAISGGFDRAADAVTEFVMTGKASFSDLAKSVVADLIKIQIKSTILGPISGFLSKLVPGGGAAVTAPRPAFGAADFDTSDFAGQMAGGGYIPPGKWALVGERGPEPAFGGPSGTTVFPNGSGAPVVNIRIVEGSGTRAEATQKADGSIDIRTMLDDAVAGSAGRRGTKTNRLMRASGFNPPLIDRG